MPASRSSSNRRNSKGSAPFLVRRIQSTEPFLIPIHSPSSHPKLGIPDYEYTAFGESPGKDRAAIQMLVDRAIRRLNHSQERTVYVFVWPENESLPVFAERLVSHGQQYAFSHDFELLRRLPWKSESTSLYRRIETNPEWVVRNASDKHYIPDRGLFAFYRPLGTSVAPFFEDLSNAFGSFYASLPPST